MRSQFPFASQDGFIHCTVDPGISAMSTLLVWPFLTSGSESLKSRPTDRAEKKRWEIVFLLRGGVNGKASQTVEKA